MKKLATLCIVLAIVLCMSAALAENSVDFGEKDFGSSLRKHTYPKLTVQTDEPVTTVVINVDSGSIVKPTISGATVNTSLSNGTVVINYTSPQTAADIQAMLRTIVFECAPGTRQHVTIHMEESVTQGVPAGTAITLKDVNGKDHYYAYVSSYSALGQYYATWYDAYNYAKSMTLLGLKGYLVTITSAAEDKVLDDIYDGEAWSAGYRVADHNDVDWDHIDTSNPPPPNNETHEFYWACGPEAGDPINDNSDPNYYAHWCSGEPNNYGSGEWAMLVHYSYEKNWNDYHPENSLPGFFVEFGGYDTDPAEAGGTTKVVIGDFEDDVDPKDGDVLKDVYEAAEAAMKKINDDPNLTNAEKFTMLDAVDRKIQQAIDTMKQYDTLEDVAAHKDEIAKIPADIKAIASKLDLLSEISKKVAATQKQVDKYKGIPEDERAYYKRRIEDDGNDAKYCIQNYAESQDDIDYYMQQFEADMNRRLFELPILDLLYRYAIDPDTQDIIWNASMVTPQNANRIASSEKAWKKLTAEQKEYTEYYYDIPWDDILQAAKALVVPETGDDTNVVLMLLMLFTACTGFVGATYLKKKYK